MSALESKITITAIDHVTGIVKDINKSLQSIKGSVSSLGNAWSNVGVAASDFATRIRNIALVGIGVGASIFGLTKHYASYAKELELSSLRTGVAIDNLQKLQYAASLSGVGVDELNTSLKFLNRSIAVASSNPTSQQAAAFYSMGISVRDANGQLKDANSLILEVSSKFAKATDAAKMTATAMAIFGRQGTTLIPFLREGPVHIKAFEAELTKLGHVWTPTEIQLGQGFEESFIKLKTAVGGLAQVLAINLMPVIKPIIDYMKDWVIANKLWLVDNIKKDVVLLGSSLKLIWQHLKAIKDAVMPVVEALGGFKGIIGILIASYLARLAFSFLNLVTALLNFGGAITSIIGGIIGSIFGLGKALASIAWVVLANPITFYVAALGLIGFAIYELIKHWADLKIAMISVWTSVQPYIEGFLNIVTLGMYSAVKSIYNNWDSIKPYLANTWSWISNTAFYYFNAVYNTVARFMAPILPYIKAVWNSVKNFLVGILNDILGLFGTNLDAVEAKISSVLESIKQGMIEFANFIITPFKAAFDFFENLYDKILNIKKLISFGGESANPNNANPVKKTGIVQTVIGDAKDLIQKGAKGIGNLLPSQLNINELLNPLKANQQLQTNSINSDQTPQTNSLKALQTPSLKPMPFQFPNFTLPSPSLKPMPFQFPNFTLPSPQNSHIDINMTIDSEGRPTKVTANTPSNISFTASLGRMV